MKKSKAAAAGSILGASSKWPGGYGEKLMNQMQANRQQIIRMGKMSTASPMLKGAGEAVKFALKTKIPTALGFGAVASAGYLGSRAISGAGQKLNKEVKNYGEQTINQQESILKGARERNNLKAMNNPKLKKKMNSVDWSKWGQ